MAVMRQWFDRLEKTLIADAELSGLLGHGTMIGSAREFFVSRALRSVFPPSIHIGSGQVIGCTGDRSRQIDIILYDGTYPVLESQPKQGLYLVEGTIATIEVKSRIDQKSLTDALTNCLPVKAITSPMARGPSYVAPATYIFGYTSKFRSKTAARTISAWIDTIPHEQRIDGWLPEVIAGGSFLGTSNGRWVQNKMNLTTQNMSIDVAPPMMVWRQKQRFGFFLANLMYTVAARISPDHKACQDGYGASREYWDTILEDAHPIYEKPEIVVNLRSLQPPTKRAEERP